MLALWQVIDLAAGAVCAACFLCPHVDIVGVVEY
jgi:hypothetical protein